MKIKTVAFRKLVTGPGYSNKAVEAVAEVDAGESPEDALLVLSAWVKHQLEEGGAISVDPASLRAEIEFLSRQTSQLRCSLKILTFERDKLREDIEALRSTKPDAELQLASGEAARLQHHEFMGGDATSEDDVA